MKSILLIIKNIKNLLPYFLFVFLYFFFINLETRKEKYNNRIIQIENSSSDNKLSQDAKKQLRITIPVIPYKK